MTRSIVSIRTETCVTDPMTVDANSASLLRPIVGIENRTAQEVFDIMCDRFRLAALPAPAPDHAGLVEVGTFIAASEHGVGVSWGDLGPLGSGDKIYALREPATALSAASPAPLEGVTVKPLVWVENGPIVTPSDKYSFLAECQTLVGRYRIGYAGDGWRTRFDGGIVAIAQASVEAAKASAQADYERRILSAIVGSAK